VLVQCNAWLARSSQTVNSNVWTYAALQWDPRSANEFALSMHCHQYFSSQIITIWQAEGGLNMQSSVYSPASDGYYGLSTSTDIFLLCRRSLQPEHTFELLANVRIYKGRFLFLMPDTATVLVSCRCFEQGDTSVHFAIIPLSGATHDRRCIQSFSIPDFACVCAGHEPRRLGASPGCLWKLQQYAVVWRFRRELACRPGNLRLSGISCSLRTFFFILLIGSDFDVDAVLRHHFNCIVRI